MTDLRALESRMTLFLAEEDERFKAVHAGPWAENGSALKLYSSIRWQDGENSWELASRQGVRAV